MERKVVWRVILVAFLALGNTGCLGVLIGGGLAGVVASSVSNNVLVTGGAAVLGAAVGHGIDKAAQEDATRKANREWRRELYGLD